MSEANNHLEQEAKIALQRIESIKIQMVNINKRLSEVYGILKEIPMIKVSGINEHPFRNKQRNKIEINGDCLPDKIWFKLNGIIFYIDFTIRTLKIEKNTIFVGCFFYGNSYFNPEGKIDDKSLVSFNIDNQGIIKANNRFENEAWTIDKEALADLHLRAIDDIWEEALYIINKDKF
ncbi:hypothetical protein ACFLRZ_03290 [Bacteroidota bacterium]